MPLVGCNFPLLFLQPFQVFITYSAFFVSLPFLPDTLLSLPFSSTLIIVPLIQYTIIRKKKLRVIALINIKINTCCTLQISKRCSTKGGYLHTKECSVQTRILIQHLNDQSSYLMLD